MQTSVCRHYKGKQCPGDASVPKTTLGDMVQYFRNACEVQRSRDLTDADLLRRFLAEREGAAFAVLMQRHGPMVLGLCKRILGDLHSAEDAFQATFMVLVRRAASLRCTGSLGNWLYAAAKRIALKARARAIARQRLERRVEIMPRAEPIDESTWQELRTVLDEEIGKLPKKYRAAIILCHLESKSHEQAAKELAWPKATLTSRVVRGRDLLRQGLVRRGITLSAAAVITALAQKATAAPVAAMLTLSTVKAATSVLAGDVLAGVGLSAGAVALAEETMKGIFWMKAKVMLLVLLLGFGAAGAGWAGYRGFVEKPAPSNFGAAPGPAKHAVAAQEKPVDAEKLFRDMEKKITTAKSVKVLFEMGPLVQDDNLNGSVFFAQGNNTRLEATFKDKGYLLVSNGKDLVDRDPAGPFRGLRATPKRFNMDLGVILTRVGGYFPLVFSQTLASKGPDHDFQVAKSVTVSNFSLGPKERVGKRQAQVIEYLVEVTIKGEGAKFRVMLWVDLESTLPLKRTLKASDPGAKEATVEEIYSEFLIDSELDPKLFVLPKDNDIFPGTKAAASAKNSPVSPARVDVHGDPLPENALVRFGTIRWRPGPTSSAVFAPASNVVVSHVVIGNITRIWDLVTGRPLKQFDLTYLGAFSADGKLMLDRSGSLVDIVTGQPLRGIGGFRQANGVALSADGQIAAVSDAREGSKITLWDTATGNELRRLEGHTAAVGCLCFSPDAKVLASGSRDGTVRLWDVATGKQLRQIAESAGEVPFVGYSPDGKLLVWADGEGVLRVWDFEQGKLLHELPSISERFPANRSTRNFGAFSAAFAPDSRLLAFAGWNGRIILWDPRTGKEIRQWAAHADAVTSVSFSGDGKMLASVGLTDSAIRLWEVATGKQLNVNKAHTGDIRFLYYTEDGKTIRSGARDLKALEWDALSGKDRRLLFDGFLLPTPTVALELIDISADGKLLAYRERQMDSFTIHVWDTLQGKELRTLNGGKAPGNGGLPQRVSKFSPDGKWLAYLGPDGLRFFDAAGGVELRFVEGIVAVEFAQDSKTIFLAGPGNTVRHVEIPTWKILRQLDTPPNVGGVFAVSPDGRYMASVDNLIAVAWATATGSGTLRVGRDAGLAKKGDIFYASALAFSPSGRVLAIGGYSNAAGIQLWDVRSGQKIGEIDAPRGWGRAMTFSPDGRTLAASGDDSTILLWDLTGESNTKVKSGTLTAADINSLWSDLAGDAATADKAIWALARAGDHGVPLLSERMRPVPPTDAQQVAKLIADLVSDQFATRQKAAQALTDLGESAEAAMRKALKNNQPLEIRQRLEKVLEKRDQDPEIIRRLRAIEALEHIDTPQAREVLQMLTTAAPNPRAAQAAAAALQRLGKR
jgi:RNA polymerase sigma factor (sigma-70 family)